MAARFASIDDYIHSFPDDVQLILEQVRVTIRSAVPDAGEKISYQMPTITLDDQSLVYFAGWKHHIGLYPIPRADDALEAEIAPYRGSKDTVKFPLREPMPYDLIARLTTLLVTRRRTSSE
ncbi:MAG: DUF1801 domain-containing protein [Geodermatophilaceae bacterium]|nr:DUF1801 domain-containing protein [Geodermatophilaceae bacterium]